MQAIPLKHEAAEHISNHHSHVSSDPLKLKAAAPGLEIDIPGPEISHAL